MMEVAWHKLDPLVVDSVVKLNLRALPWLVCIGSNLSMMPAIAWRRCLPGHLSLDVFASVLVAV